MDPTHRILKPPVILQLKDTRILASLNFLEASWGARFLKVANVHVPSSSPYLGDLFAGRAPGFFCDVALPTAWRRRMHKKKPEGILASNTWRPWRTRNPPGDSEFYRSLSQGLELHIRLARAFYVASPDKRVNGLVLCKPRTRLH